MARVRFRERRDQVRVDFPIRIHIRDQIFDVADWSIKGFRLASPVVGLGKNDYVKGTLLLGSDTARLQFPATCEAVRVTEEGAVAFRIHEMDTDHLRFLHRIVDDWLAGQHPAFEALLLELPEDQRHYEQQSRWWRLLRSILQFFILLMLILIAGFLLGRGLLTISADYATVSAPLVKLASPHDGRIHYLQPLGYNGMLEQGMPLARIENHALSARKRELDYERAETESRIQQLRQRQREYESALESHRAALAQSRAALARHRSAREEQLQLATRHYERCQRLIASNGCAQTEADQRLQEVVDIRGALADLDTRSAAMDLEAKLHEQGLLRDDLRETVPSLAVLEEQHNRARVRLDEIEAEISAIENSMVLTSPCDCLLAEWHVNDGASLVAGEIIALLTRPEGIAVDSLIAAERAHRLKHRQSVELHFANGAVRRGRVEDIRYNSRNPARYGLPDILPGSAMMARVRIHVDDLDPAWQGMTVELRIHTAGWNRWRFLRQERPAQE